MAVYDGENPQYTYGGRLEDFGLPAKGGRLAKVWNNLLRVRKYAKLVRREKFDVLFEFISINSPISALRHSKRLRLISSRDFSVLKSCTDRFAKCLNAADALVCNSQYLKSYYLSKHPEHCEKVFAIYNIIDKNEILDQAKGKVDTSFSVFIANHEKVLVTAGRFCKEKGYGYLIEAFAYSRQAGDNYGLVLIGDGDYKDRYLKIIDDHGLNEHVFFTGYQQNPYKYMSKCDCFVLSSLSEGFPNVLAEAMALSLPVIATNCFSGPAEILREDMNYEAVTDKYKECKYGILTPRLTEQSNEKAVKQLAEAIRCLLGNQILLEHYSNMSEIRSADFSDSAAIETLNMIFETLLLKRGIK